MALFGPDAPARRCPLIGEERKFAARCQSDAIDPERTLALSSDPFDLKPCFDLDHVWSVSRWVLKWSAVANMNRYKLITNHWFVSVETPKKMRLLSSAAPRPRATKSFPTEFEAKQFAIAMLSEGRKVTAGTLSPHQPIRRTITASEINQWIGEEE
jgi:hypothetical protein